MVDLASKYNFTKEHSGELVGCVFDWFEVRVKAMPLISELEKYGYSETLDKGCATHLHYFETPNFSVSWDIKSSYINKIWSHFRVKNEVFYSIRGEYAVVDYVIETCKKIFDCSDDDICISRIDFAFDMPTGSFYHNVLRSKFENRGLGVDKYTEFHGKVGNRIFTNLSAGSRSARLFFRLYYKTIENTSFSLNVPKKQYIADWHKKLFGNVDVVRFECEYKPNGNHILTRLVYNVFKDLFDKYAAGCCVKLQLCERYESLPKIEFSRKEAKQLFSLLSHFKGFYPDSSVFVSDVLKGCEFILERI